MQYKDTTNKNGMVQLAESLISCGDGGITNNATLLKQFTGYFNMAYWEVWMAIMSVDKSWKADDFNYTDYPEAPITLVNNQRDYTLPVATTGANVATLLRINRVWVLLNNGIRQELTPMSDDYDYSSITVTGIPTQYRLHGKSIYLDPIPTTGSLTLTNGLIIQFQRIPDAFLYSDTTKQPGFMETYHDLLPLKASAWYLLPINPQLANLYEQRFLTRLELLKRDIANKDDNRPHNMSTLGVTGR